MGSEPEVHPTSTPAPRRRASVVGVLGELLITCGVVALLFVAWQVWIGDAIASAQEHSAAEELAQSWAEPSAPPDDGTGPADGPEPTPVAPGDIPVLGAVSHGDQFGVMYVPRFGEQWKFRVASGITRKDILDQGFIGHYDDTPLPGAVGNTAYAAHRWTSGAPFDPIDRLVIGDAIVIETKEGWYTYRFRDFEYVQDTQIEVLLPVPQRPDVMSEGRYLTLTSCAPKFNMMERIIAYALFDEFTPRADGAPAALTEGVPT
ncbi:class E sortase [Microbacterium sp.]|uniref:class E sortase n=1 Tax=Microbacterium sp. TaxID=51671 RepID=UPI003A84CAA0